jgi:hypothetical protein
MDRPDLNSCRTVRNDDAAVGNIATSDDDRSPIASANDDHRYSSLFPAMAAATITSGEPSASADLAIEAPIVIPDDAADSSETAMRRRESYPGGKAQAGVYQKIINQIPPHAVYIEAFLGAGAILRAKRPARQSIGIDRDRAVIDRWSNCSIAGLATYCADAIEFLSRYRWQGNEVVYADPPYVRASRSYQRDLYRFEMDDEDHARLLAVLKTLPVPVLISGYWSSLYAEALAGWRSLTFNAVKRSGEVAEEWLWCNFPEPVELHDYRYLGEDFRQRERIKRKTERWRKRLDRMPLLERRALMLALSGDDRRHRRDGRGWPTPADLTMTARAGTTGNDEARASAEMAMQAPIAGSDDADGGTVRNGDVTRLES